MLNAESQRALLLPVLDAFAVQGEPVRFSQWTDGHINRTYLVETRSGDRQHHTVLQCVNSRVFQNIDALMSNATRVSEHAVRKLEERFGAASDGAARGAIRFLRTRFGEATFPDASGDAWRAYPCIGGARAERLARSPDEAYEAARAFGEFQRILCDLPGERLIETIPGFHDTSRRFDQLNAAAREDTRARTREVRGELQALDTRCRDAAVLQRAFQAGAFPERVVHNDAKFSNVLLDERTRKAVCVIDLDTVMPGFGLHDFGDLVRSICNPADEAERDLSQVELRLPYFEALVSGYLDATAEVLTAGEVELLPDAGWVLTLELAVRFLADYLNGDIYFRVAEPDHNLVRARTQLTFVRRSEESTPALRTIVRRIAPSRL